jgi:hypothetical protein
MVGRLLRLRMVQRPQLTRCMVSSLKTSRCNGLVTAPSVLPPLKLRFFLGRTTCVRARQSLRAKPYDMGSL